MELLVPALTLSGAVLLVLVFGAVTCGVGGWVRHDQLLVLVVVGLVASYARVKQAGSSAQPAWLHRAVYAALLSGRLLLLCTAFCPA